MDTLKPLVNGKMVADALRVRPGPWTGRALEIIIEWQLRNPNEQDKDKAIAEVQARQGELALNR